MWCSSWVPGIVGPKGSRAVRFALSWGGFSLSACGSHSFHFAISITWRCRQFLMQMPLLMWTHFHLETEQGTKFTWFSYSVWDSADTMGSHLFLHAENQLAYTTWYCLPGDFLFLLETSAEKSLTNSGVNASPSWRWIWGITNCSRVSGVPSCQQ